MKRSTAEFLGTGGGGHNSSTIEEVAVGALHVDPGDPWKYKQEDMERAMPFVRRYGAAHVSSIMIDGDNNVIIGAVFVAAARDAGIKTLRVVRQIFPDPTERRLFSLAGSKILSTGFWDGNALAEVILEFEKSIEDFSHDLIAFPPGMLDKLIGASISSSGADELPVTRSLRAVSYIGQLWIAGPHRVICGDSTDTALLAVLMAGRQAAAACLDPPFGCPVDGFVAKKGAHREFVQASGEMTEPELLEFFRRLCGALTTTLRPGALVYRLAKPSSASSGGS